MPRGPILREKEMGQELFHVFFNEVELDLIQWLEGSGLIPNAYSLYVEVCAPDGKLALPSVYECVSERENVDL